MKLFNYKRNMKSHEPLKENGAAEKYDADIQNQ
jgi:hypothetical protein